MSYLEVARKIVCSVIAVALSMTVAAVEGLLPHRPDWLERVENVATTLRAAGRNAADVEGTQTSRRHLAPPPALPDPGDLALDVDRNRLLLAYGALWDFVQDVRSDGLSLDENFCERIESEWSVSTLLTYMRNADKSLQEHASRAMDTAAEILTANRPDEGV